jgi:hypothetical protein
MSTHQSTFTTVDEKCGLLISKGNPSETPFRFYNLDGMASPTMLSLSTSGNLSVWIGSPDHVTGDHRIWESKGASATQSPDATGVTHSWIVISLNTAMPRGIFVSLASYICTKCIEANSTRAVIVVAALDEWKRLFQGRSEGLTSNELAGLIGELLTLEELALAIGPRALDCWQGFEGESHDFRCGDNAIETKTSTGQGNSIAINGIQQLVEPQHGQLVLRHIRLQQNSPQGVSLMSLIEHLVILGVNKSKLEECVLRLGTTTEQLNDTSHTYKVIERHAYSVTEGFPRITQHSFSEGKAPTGVTSIKYAIDLNACDRFTLKEDEYNKFIKSL